MSEAKKAEESKTDAATQAEQGELSAEDLEKVAGGVLNLGGVTKVGNAQLKQLPAVQLNFDPNIDPTKGGGTLE